MPNESRFVKALCPFWNSSSGKSISCEGLLSEFCRQQFPTSKDRDRCEKKYCQDDWESCPHAKAVWASYEQA